MASATADAPRAAAEHAGLGHWPEYIIEATLLAVFMVAACGFTILLEHPALRVGDQLLERLGARRETAAMAGAGA